MARRPSRARPAWRRTDTLRYEDGAALRLDSDFGGRIGRLKLAIADWDGDGLPDLLVAGSGTQPIGANPYKKSTVFLLRNTRRPRPAPLRPPGARPAGRRAARPSSGATPASRRPGISIRRPVAGATGPICRRSLRQFGYSGAARPDLLVGSENGRVYAFRRGYIDGKATVDARLERG